MRRALKISRGDPMVFLTRPRSLTLLIIATVLLALGFGPKIARKRELAFQEE